MFQKKMYFCCRKINLLLTKKLTQMKKVMAIFGAALLLAGVATSCNKKCECKTYLNGVVMSTTELELDKNSYKKCSEMNTVVELNGTKNGIECTAK